VLRVEAVSLRVMRSSIPSQIAAAFQQRVSSAQKTARNALIIRMRVRMRQTAHRNAHQFNLYRWPQTTVSSLDAVFIMRRNLLEFVSADSQQARAPDQIGFAFSGIRSVQHASFG